MACAVPCVATNVGDAVEIVENTGVIAAPRRTDTLATALADVMDRNSRVSS